MSIHVAQATSLSGNKYLHYERQSFIDNLAQVMDKYKFDAKYIYNMNNII